MVGETRVLRAEGMWAGKFEGWGCPAACGWPAMGLGPGEGPEEWGVVGRYLKEPQLVPRKSGSGEGESGSRDVVAAGAAPWGRVLNPHHA